MSAFFVVLLGGSGKTSPVVNAIGVVGISAVGNVSVGSEQIADLTGVSALANVGQAQVLSNVNVLLNGVSAEAQLGNESIQIGGDITTVVSGVSATTQTGNVAVSTVRNIAVTTTGTLATALIGAANVRGSSISQATGISATSLVSSTTARGGATTLSNSVFATGGVGEAEVGQENYIGTSGSWTSKSPSTIFVSMYPWTNTGWGAKFAEPAVLPASTPRSMASTPSGKSIAVGWSGASSAPPYVSVYAWSGSGFGAKFSDPATSLDGGNGLTFNPDSSILVVSMSTTFPRISAYNWNDTTGWGTRLSAVGFSTPGLAYNGKFSADGNSLIIPHATSPYITAFPWSISGPGTRFSNPSTLPSNTCTSVSLNASQNKVAVSQSTSPFMHEYAYSSSTGWGAKSSNPSSPLTAGSNAVAYHPSNDDYVVFATTSSPFVVAYENYSVRLSNPAQLPFGAVQSITFSEDGNTLFLSNLTNSSTPSGLLAYEWNNGIGVRYSDPATSYGLTSGGGTTFI
jgi:hypothetical protein